jgi:hypothetical protein
MQLEQAYVEHHNREDIMKTVKKRNHGQFPRNLDKKKLLDYI